MTSDRLFIAVLLKIINLVLKKRLVALLNSHIITLSRCFAYQKQKSIDMCITELSMLINSEKRAPRKIILLFPDISKA